LGAPVNNAGIFLTKRFIDFTTEDFDALASTNLLGFFYITQRAVKAMLRQKSGCVVNITATLADRPIAGENSSISMITKGGLNSATQNLAIDYAKDGIRFNAVAPGVRRKRLRCTIHTWNWKSWALRTVTVRLHLKQRLLRRTKKPQSRQVIEHLASLRIRDLWAE